MRPVEGASAVMEGWMYGRWERGRCFYLHIDSTQRYRYTGTGVRGSMGSQDPMRRRQELQELRGRPCIHISMCMSLLGLGCDRVWEQALIRTCCGNEMIDGQLDSSVGFPVHCQLQHRYGIHSSEHAVQQSSYELITDCST